MTNRIHSGILSLRTMLLVIVFCTNTYTDTYTHRGDFTIKIPSRGNIRVCRGARADLNESLEALVLGV